MLSAPGRLTVGAVAPSRRSFASFPALNIGVSAAHGNFCAGFDSRQLHNKRPGVADVDSGGLLNAALQEPQDRVRAAIIN